MGSTADSAGGIGAEQWDTAVRLARSLLAGSDRGLREELAIWRVEHHSDWFVRDTSTTEVVAAALCHAATRSALPIEQAPLCTAARIALTSPIELMHGVPIGMDTYLAWHGPNPRMPLRVLRALACPGQHTPDGPGADCVRVCERLAVPDEHASRWRLAEASGRLVAMDTQGAGTITCTRCGAADAWLLAHPTAARDWIWQVCRCGSAAPLAGIEDEVLHTLIWQEADVAGLLSAAERAGFGQIEPEGANPGTTRYFARLLPGLSRGGDESWRAAIRAAMSMLAHAPTPETAVAPLEARRHDAPVPDLMLAALLAALIMHVLGRQTGLPAVSIDLPGALAAGPEAVYAQLAELQPGGGVVGCDTWLSLAAWPDGELIERNQPYGDPAQLAWSALAFAPRSTDGATGRAFPHASAYRDAYTLLTGLLA
jgi:hypothetical protein